MVWWLVGLWLASAPLVPLLWLLSTTRAGIGRYPDDASVPAGRARRVRAIASRGPILRYALCGLTGFAALIFLLMGSLGNPMSTMRAVPATETAAQAPVAGPTEPPSPAPTIDVTAIQPESADAAAPQLPPISQTMAAADPAAPERPLRSVVARAMRHDRRGSVKAFVVQSNRGTWLFAPNQNGGGNS